MVLTHDGACSQPACSTKPKTNKNDRNIEAKTNINENIIRYNEVAETMEESKMEDDKPTSSYKETNHLISEHINKAKDSKAVCDHSNSDFKTVESKINTKNLCQSNSGNLNSDDKSEVDSVKEEVASDESEVDSDDSSFSAKQPIFIRPAFKPKARMFKPRAVAAPPSQFIMDVPEMWGVGADGSMMEVFNKLEIKE